MNARKATKKVTKKTVTKVSANATKKDFKSFIIACSSNNEYPAENINGFVLNINKDLIKWLEKKKKAVIATSKKSSSFLSIKWLWDQENGEFTPCVSDNVEEFLCENEYVELTDSSLDNTRKNDMKVEGYDFVLDKTGFCIQAYEKYSPSVEWCTVHLSWKDFDKMTNA